MSDEQTTHTGPPSRPRVPARPLSWGRAFGWGVLIFLYFAVASVWLVSYAIEKVFADIGGFEGDVLALSLWGGVMAAGIWGLRQAQERGFFG